MATAKKKTSAKRTVKYAAKASSGAAQATSAAAATNWVNKGAADWQKGANEWLNQSAKLYQLPFAQGDVGAAGKQAADTMKSAADNMMKVSSEMMQQFFDKSQQAASKSTAGASFNPQAMFSFPKSVEMPNFDPAAAQEKLQHFARESAEQMSKSTSQANRAMQESMQIARENAEALTQAVNLATALSKELGADLISYLNKSFAQNVELSKQVLSCRTLNDMFDLSSRCMKTNLDAFFSESVKLSEKLFQCATDISEPLNERASETSRRLTKAFLA